MLAIRVDWLTAAYEAADTPDTTTSEWPPHPIRPFCAMVAAARTDADWAALRWLEAQAPPVVLAPTAARPDVPRQAYVPTNAVDAKDRHQRYPVRISGQFPRTWPRSYPVVPTAVFVWEDVAPTTVTTDTLSRLCEQVAYVGRATSPALVSLASGDPPTEDLVEYRPASVTTTASTGVVRIRVPYEGYVDRLRTAYDAALPSWDVARTLLYRAVDTATAPLSPEPVDGPYRELVVLGFRRDGERNGRRVVLDGAHAVTVSAALRRAVMSRAEAVLPALHGHHDGTTVQCAYLALPDVVARDEERSPADGHLLGVAVALPATLLPDERRTVLRAVIGADPGAHEDANSADDGADRGLVEIVAGPLGRLAVGRGTDGRSGLREQRWTRRSSQWASVLPVVLDRFPKRRDDLAVLVADACENAGYPRPVEVAVDRTSFVVGGVDLRPEQTVRRRGERRWLPYRHVLLTFPGPVHGPVVVGSMRHFGLGLCLPLP